MRTLGAAAAVDARAFLQRTTCTFPGLGSFAVAAGYSVRWWAGAVVASDLDVLHPFASHYPQERYIFVAHADAAASGRESDGVGASDSDLPSGSPVAGPTNCSKCWDVEGARQPGQPGLATAAAVKHQHVEYTYHRLHHFHGPFREAHWEVVRIVQPVLSDVAWAASDAPLCCSSASEDDASQGQPTALTIALKWCRI